MDTVQIFIIKKVCADWDGCNGYDEDEYWTNHIYLSEEKAYDKCRELNKEYGYHGCGSSLKFKVVEDYAIK